MNDHLNVKRYLFTAGSFIGGAAVGFLLAPLVENVARRNGKSFAGHPVRVAGTESDAIRHGKRILHNLRNNFKEFHRNHVPDLYKATEHLALEEGDLING